jgi:hypothetical protein
MALDAYGTLEVTEKNEKSKRAIALQRERRARLPRVDYYPSPEAMAIIESRRTRHAPTNSNGRILEVILAEWATLTGLKMRPIEPPVIADTRTRSSPSDEGETIRNCQTKRAPAHVRITSGLAPPKAVLRVPCGARRRRDGLPCEALSVPGKRRCRWHGGASTGPRTDEGRARSIRNLRQFKEIEYDILFRPGGKDGAKARPRAKKLTAKSGQ